MPQASRGSSKSQTGVTATFVHDKVTANTVRFEEEVDNGKTPVIGRYVYITKAAYEKLGEPEAIDVTVKVATE